MRGITIKIVIDGSTDQIPINDWNCGHEDNMCNVSKNFFDLEKQKISILPYTVTIY